MADDVPSWVTLDHAGLVARWGPTVPGGRADGDRGRAAVGVAVPASEPDTERREALVALRRRRLREDP